MLVFRGTNRDTSRIPNGSDASRTEPKSSESTRTSPRNSDQSPTLVEAREAYERDYIQKKSTSTTATSPAPPNP